VDVPHCLPAVLAGIDDDAITTLIESLGGSDLGQRDKQVPEKLPVALLDVSQAGDMPVRDDEDMDRRDGVDILKRRHRAVLIHLFTGDLPGHDTTKDTILFHSHPPPRRGVSFASPRDDSFTRSPEAPEKPRRRGDR